jgi:predicted PurR-regulated permease PerM
VSILKLLAVMVVLLIVIVGFASFLYYQTSSISGDLVDSLSAIKQHLEEDKWEKAQQELNQLNRHWEKADRWWTPVMDHREIDMLDQSIGRVSTWVEVQNKDEALVEVNVAIRMVKRLLDREGFNISNLF